LKFCNSKGVSVFTIQTILSDKEGKPLKHKSVFDELMGNTSLIFDASGGDRIPA